MGRERPLVRKDEYLIKTRVSFVVCTVGINTNVSMHPLASGYHLLLGLPSGHGGRSMLPVSQQLMQRPKCLWVWSGQRRLEQPSCVHLTRTTVAPQLTHPGSIRIPLCRRSRIGIHFVWSKLLTSMGAEERRGKPFLLVHPRGGRVLASSVADISGSASGCATNSSVFLLRFESPELSVRLSS